MKKSDLYKGFRYPAEIISHVGYAPRVLVTDKLKSYAAAKADIMLSTRENMS